MGGPGRADSNWIVGKSAWATAGKGPWPGDDNGRGRLGKHGHQDHTGIRAVGGVRVEVRSVQLVLRDQRAPGVSKIVEPVVDQPALERRNDDQVHEPENERNDAKQGQAEPGPYRPKHVHQSRKR